MENVLLIFIKFIKHEVNINYSCQFSTVYLFEIVSLRLTREQIENSLYIMPQHKIYTVGLTKWTFTLEIATLATTAKKHFARDLFKSIDI